LNISSYGKIINTKTGDPVPAKVLSGIVDGRFKNTYISDDGTFNLKIPKGVDYTIVAEVPGHVGKKQTINFNKNHIFYKEYTYNLEVEPIEPGMKIETDPIYFEQSKAIVLKKSYPALDKLAIHLKDHPTLYVKIEGHTDNQGDRKALIKLSEKRAEAIKEYLVYQKRVNPVRIETIGIGPDQPVNDNSSADLRSMNRRVEVIVTSSASQVLGLQSDGEK